MLAILMTASAMLVGCAPADEPNESTPNESTPNEPSESTPEESTPEVTPEPTEPESTPESTPEETEPEAEPVVDNFEKYRSNIAYGTGHNAMVVSENGGKELGRLVRLLVAKKNKMNEIIYSA